MPNEERLFIKYKLIKQKTPLLMEQSITDIKNALVNSLSLDAALRDQAQNFLIKQCEPDPNFQTALLHIIKSYSNQI